MNIPEMPSKENPGGTAPAANSQPAPLVGPPIGKVRHIGIHGARGTGKTSYLACLYGHRATEQATVSFSCDTSKTSLARMRTI
jgi:hypothetical protein